MNANFEYDIGISDSLQNTYYNTTTVPILHLKLIKCKSTDGGILKMTSWEIDLMNTVLSYCALLY